MSVAYARSVTVTVDGQTRQVSTTARTVDGALAAMGLRGDGARLSVSRSMAIGRNGLSLSVVTPKQVSVVADGRTVEQAAVASTVGEALVALRIGVDQADQVTPATTAALTDGLTVTIRRVTHQDTTRTETIAFATERAASATVYAADSRVERGGAAGVRTITTRQTLLDGKVTATATIASRVTRAPVGQVVLVGTRSRPVPAAPKPTSTPSAPSAPSAPTSGGSSSGGSGGAINLARASMWDRIAACESGANWSINTGNGYFGGLQFAASTWTGAGGGDFASRADLASRAEQITVANRLYASSGTSPWGCA